MKSRIFAISALLILQLFFNEAFSQDARNEKFRQGVDLFTSGSFDKALDQWIDLYNTGYRSAELEYNIGNAYFKQNNIPGAILFYERAHLLKPADEDINYNLQIARTMIVDRFEEIPELFFVRWFDFVSLTLSTNTWAKISIAAFVLCLLFLSLYFYSSKYNLKVLGFWFALLLILVSFSSLAFSAANRQMVRNSHKAIIFSPQISGKSSPDNSGTDLFILHEGTKVTTIEKVGEWFEIRLSDGNKGWIPAGSIQII
jgi:Bacterial SH3 domain./Tetratricopeptide repeat.